MCGCNSETPWCRKNTSVKMFDLAYHKLQLNWEFQDDI